MAGNLEQRVWRLENALTQINKQLTDISDQIAKLQQSQYAAGGGGGGGGGGSNTCYFCYLAYPISPATAPPDPSSIPGGPAGPQQIYGLFNGAYVSAGTAIVYNGLTTQANAGFTSVLLQNSDGTFSIVTQGCT